MPRAFLLVRPKALVGVEICQGKLAVYTLCAGLDPSRICFPVVAYVGTDNPQFAATIPSYPGCRQAAA